MIKVETLFRNHFDSQNITNIRFRAFVEDYINKTTAKLSVQPNAVIQALLNNTLPLYNGYFGAISSEDIKFSVQQSRTVAADKAWVDLLAFIRKKEGTVRGIWGKEAPEYQEFYPLGLEEYNKAGNIKKPTILERYLDAATSHQAVLGADFVTDFTNLKIDWEQKYNTQQLQIGLVKDAASQRETNRTPLELQMTRNMLVIAAEFAGQPEMANDFFNQSLLQAPQHELPKKGNIVPGITRVAARLNKYEADFEWKLENVLGGPLEFGLSIDGKTFAGTTVTLAKPGMVKHVMAHFGVNATTLLVRNQGSTVGRWRVSRG
jgi:hypothetical protein